MGECSSIKEPKADPAVPGLPKVLAALYAKHAAKPRVDPSNESSEDSHMAEASEQETGPWD
eukprot:15485676-Alexandrium_andersonii.AAC.1